MTIEKKPFVRYDPEDKKKEDIVMLRLNPKERELLNEYKRLVQQPKDATGIKGLIELGWFALHGTPRGMAFSQLFKNIRKNRRVGIVEVE